MGGSRDIVSALQLALADALPTLAEAGVLVPAAGRASTGRGGVSHKGLADTAASDWSDLNAEIAASDADTVLLVVPAWLRMVDEAARQRAVVERLHTVADQIIVISVVGDQLTLINEHYRHQVAVWRVSGRLASLAPRFLNNQLFAHEQLLRPWYEQDMVTYVAVPYHEYTAGNPLEVVLQAAGVPLADPLGQSPAPLVLGPVGVEANRLLATYLRSRVNDFASDAKPVIAASRTGLARAEKQGWCVRRFWGWTRETAEETVDHFDAGNQEFAQAVWGTGWHNYPLNRKCRQLDLLDLDGEVIDRVVQYVTSMSDKLVPQLKGKR